MGHIDKLRNSSCCGIGQHGPLCQCAFQLRRVKSIKVQSASTKRDSFEFYYEKTIAANVTNIKLREKVFSIDLATHIYYNMLIYTCLGTFAVCCALQDDRYYERQQGLLLIKSSKTNPPSQIAFQSHMISQQRNQEGHPTAYQWLLSTGHNAVTFMNNTSIP